MIRIEVIEKVMDEILKEEIDYSTLKNKLEDFKLFLLSLVSLDLEEEQNRKDIQSENGIALCTTFAAMCINDIIRTRQFIRGVYKAVAQVRAQQSGPVKILYAGTGPFATLILPLLTKYDVDDLQLVLLEVNKQTVAYLKKLIKQLGIENYVEKIECEDASSYKIEGTNEIDILVSETMQHGLVKEQQVPIMLNLVSQLHKQTIIIPNKIKLDLALMNSSAELLLEMKSNNRYKELKTLLEFDKEFIYSFIEKNPNWEREVQFELCERIDFQTENNKDLDKLVVLTSIQVHNEEWIKYDSSSLTIPNVLFRLEEMQHEKKELSLYYVVREIPDFEYELN